MSNAKIKHIILWTIVIFLVSASFSHYKTSKNKMDEIASSVDKGLTFLLQKQADYGELKSEMCEKKELDDCSFVSSLFTTSSIVYSIQDIKNEKAQKIKDGALSFLLSEGDQRGLWRYFGKRSTEIKIVPDMDDTSLTSFVLKKNNKNFPNNETLLKNNRNDAGTFYTWIDPFGINGENNIDCVVNANVLLYLQENDPAVCAYLNKSVLEKENCAVYYPNKLAVYYAISRSFKEGVSCLGENKEFIVDDLLKKQFTNGSFGNDLENALALNTLLNFDYSGEKIVDGFNHVLKNQMADGSWKKESYYNHGNSTPPHFGSAELTTAISLEALNKFQEDLFWFSKKSAGYFEVNK